jgi:predicted nucleic acid-binding Zn ribbon protein
VDRSRELNRRRRRATLILWLAMLAVIAASLAAFAIPMLFTN